MAFVQDRLYNQTSVLTDPQHPVDPRLQGGVCFSLCIEWSEKVLQGQRPNLIDFNIFRHVSRQRAYLETLPPPSPALATCIQDFITYSLRFLTEQAKAYRYEGVEILKRGDREVACKRLRIGLAQMKAIIILQFYPFKPKVPLWREHSRTRRRRLPDMRQRSRLTEASRCISIQTWGRW